jgi:hypothetical protein
MDNRRAMDNLKATDSLKPTMSPKAMLAEDQARTWSIEVAKTLRANVNRLVVLRTMVRRDHRETCRQKDNLSKLALGKVTLVIKHNRQELRISKLLKARQADQDKTPG